MSNKDPAEISDSLELSTHDDNELVVDNDNDEVATNRMVTVLSQNDEKHTVSADELNKLDLRLAMESREEKKTKKLLHSSSSNNNNRANIAIGVVVDYDEEEALTVPPPPLVVQRQLPPPPGAIAIRPSAVAIERNASGESDGDGNGGGNGDGDDGNGDGNVNNNEVLAEEPEVPPMTTLAVADSTTSNNTLVSAVLVDSASEMQRVRDEAREELLQDMVQGEVLDTEAQRIKRLRRKRRKTALLLAAILFIVVMAIVLGILLPNNNNNNIDDSSDTTAASMENEEKEDTDKEYLLEIIRRYNNDSLLLLLNNNETTSPQYQAFQWLLLEDAFSQNATTRDLPEEILLERYALAVFYFSANGYDWNKDWSFLSESSVCDWLSFPTTDDGGGEQLDVSSSSSSSGIFCNDDQQVTAITFDGINLNGTIPSELSALSLMNSLSFYYTGIHGTLPESLGDLELLERLEFINEGNIIGTIPESFQNLDRMGSFSMVGLNLSGTLPSGLLQSDPLSYVDVRYNGLTGTIPPMVHRGELLVFVVDGNQFTGTIPEALFTNNRLEAISFKQNLLEGSLSTQIGNLGFLQFFSFDSNQFTGTIPTEIGLLSNLHVGWLARNQLTGPIPSEIGNLGKFEKVASMFFTSNDFTGTLPTEFSQLSTLAYFDIENTTITGNLDPIFCVEDADWRVNALFADCGDGGSNTEQQSEVKCSCCTTCCNDETGDCQTDVQQVCENDIFGFDRPNGNIFVSIRNSPVLPQKPICQCFDRNNAAAVTTITSTTNTTTSMDLTVQWQGCSNDDDFDDNNNNPYCPFMELTCDDSSECEVCNDDGSICGVRVNFGTRYTKGGGRTHEQHGFQYTRGRNETLFYEFDLLQNPHGNNLYINGVKCLDVRPGTCRDQMIGFEVDCSNVVEGAIYNQCRGNVDNAGVLSYLTPSMWSKTPTCQSDNTDKATTFPPADD